MITSLKPPHPQRLAYLRRRRWTLFAGVTALVPFVMYASEMHLFEPKTIISASKVNQNFANLEERIGVYEDAIAVSSSNTIGIGTSNPTAGVTIAGAAGTDAAGVGLVDSATQNKWAIRQEVGNAFDIEYNGSDRLVITPDGNVGIGTASPSACSSCTAKTIHVEGENAGLRLLDTTGIAGDWLTSVNDGNYAIFDNILGRGVARMAIDTAGNVGIGTTSSTARLVVVNSVGETLRLEKASGAGLQFSRSGSLGFQIDDNAGDIRFLSGGDSERVRFTSAGNVGINTTTPAYPLDVNGLVRATNISISSDLRLKRDIRPLTRALEGIQCLQGVSYFLRDPLADQDLQLGFIAQEVERCYPEVVSTDPSGYKSVSYDRLVAPLVEAVKEQQHTLQSQSERLAAQDVALAVQQQKTARLEARLARLEALLETQK